VTGSSSGIGKSITQLLLKAGATVIGIARDHSKFGSSYENYWPYEADLENVGNLVEVVSRICSKHPNIDGFVSNAGFGEFKVLENFSPSQIVSFFYTNLLSHIILTKLFLPKIKSLKKYGNIIFIGSEAALRGHKKGTLYNASKFGLRGFAQALREECSTSNISVTIINPGMVKTNFFDRLHFRPGADKTNAIEPEDVAELVLNVLKSRKGTVIDEINLSPLKKVITFD
tara:strand:- start:170 stop:856 length:687 start_codon:yes stop_codon:yes gene_type:complete